MLREADQGLGYICACCRLHTGQTDNTGGGVCPLYILRLLYFSLMFEMLVCVTAPVEAGRCAFNFFLSICTIQSPPYLMTLISVCPLVPTSAALTPFYFVFQLLCCGSAMKLVSVLISRTHTLLADGVGESVMDGGDDTRPEQWRRLQTRALLFSAWVESQIPLLESLH